MAPSNILIYTDIFWISIFPYIKIGMEEKIHKEVDFTIQHIKDLIGTKNETTMPKGAKHKLRWQFF